MRGGPELMAFQSNAEAIIFYSPVTCGSRVMSAPSYHIVSSFFLKDLKNGRLLPVKNPGSKNK